MSRLRCYFALQGEVFCLGKKYICWHALSYFYPDSWVKNPTFLVVLPSSASPLTIVRDSIAIPSFTSGDCFLLPRCYIHSVLSQKGRKDAAVLLLLPQWLEKIPMSFL